MAFVLTPRALERACVDQNGCAFASRLVSSLARVDRPSNTHPERVDSSSRRYATPELNEVLYLHHRGIVRLEHFDPYVNLRCLHLERNAVSSLEGLRTLRSLTQLHVDGNALQNLRGVERLVNLTCLDANDNVIDTLEHARGHARLRSLTVARNHLRGDVSTVLAPLAECPALRALDVSENDLAAEDTDHACRAFATTVPDLEIFTVFKGNSRLRPAGAAETDDVRRRTARACPRLAWLDFEPVVADARPHPSSITDAPIDDR